MYFIPLSQSESVALVVHALRAAAGQADCSVCPVRKVCERQCLAIADAVERMLVDATLPQISAEVTTALPQEPAPEQPLRNGPRFTVIK